LQGEQVSFTGRLATLSRPQAWELVRRHGGIPARRVSRRTTLLVVGQDDWPLLPSGRLTRNLRVAYRLQREGKRLTVVDEYHLLARLGLVDSAFGAGGRYSLLELSHIVGVPGRQLRYWIGLGLLVPSDLAEGVPRFDFQQLAAARLLCRMHRGPAKRRRLRHSLRRLARLLPDKAAFVHALVHTSDDRLLWRSERGDLIDLSGQKHFDFDEPADCLRFEPVVNAVDPYRQAVEAENAGNLALAERCYRTALIGDPRNADLYFNLGNVLQDRSRYVDAVECYQQAIRLCPHFAEAWNNLGAALGSLARLEDACRAFRQALRIDPGYADAHYNLADTLDLLGRAADAQTHWQAYLAGGERGPWRQFVRLGEHSPDSQSDP
jgi:Flp pilus assembly protein TadD